MDIDEAGPNILEKQSSVDHFESSKPKQESVPNQLENIDEETKMREQRQSKVGNQNTKKFIGGPSSWFGAFYTFYLIFSSA